MSVLETRRTLRRRFQTAGVPDEAVSADVLLEKVLAIQPGSLARHLHDTLTPEQAARLEELACRREHREPLQYLVGIWSFLDFDLHVAPGALIPRPETEDWVSELMPLLSRQAWPVGWRFADIGTGTGAIGLALARRFPDTRGFLIDVSTAALEVAASNLALHPTEANRLFLCQASLVDACRPRSLHLVISNPPYIPHDEIDGLMSEVRDYEPHLALDGGDTGLSIISRLLTDAVRVLLPGGLIALEHGQGQRSRILKFTPPDLQCIRTIDDAGKRDRAIVWKFVP